MQKKASRGTRRRVPTGIAGLDEIMRGGLPEGRATLLLGGPGSGKTVLALETLVNGAREHGEPGIFVAFEERSEEIIANAATFGWDLPALQKEKLFFLDGLPSAELIVAGSADLTGMLAALTAKARAMKARRIVFDSLDMILAPIGDPLAERREMMRVHEWLIRQNLTALITAKAPDGEPEPLSGQSGGYMRYLTDCAIALNHRVLLGVSQRSLRVLKYRGSAFAENEAPFLIADQGIEVAAGSPSAAYASIEAPTQRVSSGVDRLDTMLGGGYYVGAGILITGSPGTAKSTLAGAFARAACKRGERVLFVSFDSAAAELVRNLASVDIHLDEPRRRGLLALADGAAGDDSAEAHYLRIRTLATKHRATAVIIDPLSALSKQGNELTSTSVVERLTRWAKQRGITLLCTSLLDTAAPELESTPLQISTIADTWIHLSYLVRGGERNRAITIVKSRGTAHSNQVRELVLSDTGVTMADVYSAGGEVLMGSLRWEKEQQALAARESERLEAARKLSELERAEAELSARIEGLHQELLATRSERQLLTKEVELGRSYQAEQRAALKKLRGADANKTRTKTKHEPA